MYGFVFQGTAFLSAELLLLLTRSADIITLAKRTEQRSARENLRVSRGLGRAVTLESILFVPASVTLLLLLSPFVIGRFLQATAPVYAVLGLISYGFPFALLRAAVTRIALNTLREFARLAPPEVGDDDH